jgi:acetyltransferase-like isoleucine patch superfamily enzyme
MRRLLSDIFLFAYRSWGRLWSKAFSLLISGSFAHFGKRTVLTPSLRLCGQERISIGEDVFVGEGSWFQTLPDGDNQSVSLSIGKGTSIAGACVLSAVRDVRLEEDVLLARNVYISDHIHKYTDAGSPVLSQGVDKISPVLIRRGAWLGQNVVVCPGVTIGMGSVIGANSVVTESNPDLSVAAGVPARVVKSIEAVAQWK